MLEGFGKLFRLPVTFLHKRCNKVRSWEGGAHDDVARPARAPPKKGHMAVYVGEEMRRYVIPTSYVSMPGFLPVMERVREVFGYDQAGGLRIPCGVDEFEELLRRMQALRK